MTLFDGELDNGKQPKKGGKSVEFNPDSLPKGVTPTANQYGTGSRSYNRSVEARQMRLERQRISEEYSKTAVPNSVVLDSSWLMCPCDYPPYPHSAHLDRLEIFEQDRKERYVPIERGTDRPATKRRKHSGQQGNSGRSGKRSRHKTISGLPSSGSDGG